MATKTGHYTVNDSRTLHKDGSGSEPHDIQSHDAPESQGDYGGSRSAPAPKGKKWDGDIGVNEKANSLAKDLYDDSGGPSEASITKKWK